MKSIEKQARDLLRPRQPFYSLENLGFGQRCKSLFNVAKKDLSLARIMEGHSDAQFILKEKGRGIRRGLLYGVWASEYGESKMFLREKGGKYFLCGRKKFCTGANFLDRALITCHYGQDIVLVDTSLKSDFIEINSQAWKASAFSSTCTNDIYINDIEIRPEDIIFQSNWYLERASFWTGAIAPAACWAGGIDALISHLSTYQKDNPHFYCHAGALSANSWLVRSILNQATQEVEAQDHLVARDERIRALRVRHLIESTAIDTYNRFTKATGPTPLIFDEYFIKKSQELLIYIRQCHAERDLESLGQLTYPKRKACAIQ